MKIRGAVLTESGLAARYSVTRPIRVEELEPDAPSPTEVLVRIEAAGICHSDLSVVNRSRPRKRVWISITARTELDDINYAMDELATGRAIRQLVEFPS